MTNGKDRNVWGIAGIVITTVTILFGGSWTVFQTQFTNIAEQQKIIRDDLARRSIDVDTNFQRINEQLLHHRDVYVEQYEYKAFNAALQKRLDIDEQRLSLIEQTRPTTGELRGIADNADKQISRILDRLDRAK